MKILIGILLFMLSHTVQACACCGVTGEWSHSQIDFPNYPSDVIKRIQLHPSPTHFQTEYAHTTELNHSLLSIDIIHNPTLKITFKGPHKLMTLHVQSPIHHKAADISFITKPSHPSNSVDIYHEILLYGSIMEKPSKKATLILQGIGNSCVESPTLQQWILQTEDKTLMASGKITSNPTLKVEKTK